MNEENPDDMPEAKFEGSAAECRFKLRKRTRLVPPKTSHEAGHGEPPIERRFMPEAGQDNPEPRSEGPEAESRPKPRKRGSPVFPKTSYEKGYGRPPAEHRFKPGQSGNPSGRPKGARNRPSIQMERLKQHFLKAAECEVKITKGDQILSMRKIDYITESFLDKAAKGNVPLIKFAVKLALEIEREEKELQEAFLNEAIKYKTRWENELAERKAKGIHNMPDPLPHPDHIVIGMDRTAKILGPTTPEEKQEYDEIQIQRKKWSEELAATDAEIREIMSTLRDKQNDRAKSLERISKLDANGDILRENLRVTEREFLYGGGDESDAELDEN